MNRSGEGVLQGNEPMGSSRRAPPLQGMIQYWPVCWSEVVGGDAVPGHPLDATVFVGNRFLRSGSEPAQKGDHPRGEVFVFVIRVGQGNRVLHGAAEFLLKFALQCGPGFFSGFDLAAGKLPLQREVFALGSLGEQDTSVSLDEGADDFDDAACRLGHGPHSGLVPPSTSR